VDLWYTQLKGLALNFTIVRLDATVSMEKSRQEIPAITVQVAVASGMIVALGGLMASCQIAPAPAGLKVGTILPITGDLSSYGGSMHKTVQLLSQTVNQCGGVLGKPMTIIAEDDQTDPNAGVAAMNKLTTVDRVGAVVGAASSATTSAILPIAVRHQVVQISPSSTSPSFTERSRRGEFQGFWFRTAPPDNFQGYALAQLFKKRGWKTISILAVNNDYGNGIITAFQPRFQSLGGTVRSVQRYDPRSVSFESELQKSFAQQPDALLLVAYPETGSLILKAAFQQGFLNNHTQIVATDGLKDQNLAPLVGKDRQGRYLAESVIGTAPQVRGQGFQAFRDRFQQTYKAEPTIYDPNTWDALALIALAAESAQSITGSGIRSKLQGIANPPGQPVMDLCQGLSQVRRGQDINYEGASGTVDLNTNGDVTGNYEVWQIQPDGTLKTLESIRVQ
jgi:ABC-type branched-subunit amino acid transport system substrate-binding protein